MLLDTEEKRLYVGEAGDLLGAAPRTTPVHIEVELLPVRRPPACLAPFRVALERMLSRLSGRRLSGLKSYILDPKKAVQCTLNRSGEVTVGVPVESSTAKWKYRNRGQRMIVPHSSSRPTALSLPGRADQVRHG
jgi:hypothetical protein